MEKGLKINAPFFKFGPFTALLLNLRLCHSERRLSVPFLRKLSVPVNNPAGGGGGVHTLTRRSPNYKRRRERATPSELQNSGLAARLAAVDSECRQSQDSQPPQPPLTAAGTMVLVLEYLRATKNFINRSCQQ